MDQMTEEQATPEEVSATEAEVQAQSSESSTETPQEDKSSNVEGRISKLTAQRYAEKRRADELESELQTLRNEKAPEVASAVEAPKLPEDIYDTEKMQAYHAEMIDYNRKLSAEAVKTTLASQQADIAKTQEAEQVTKTVQEYAERGLKDGLTIEQMQTNEQIINNAGMNPELGGFIMQDSNGAKIADYLAKNPAELSRLNAMSPMMAAVTVANEVKTKAMGPSNISSAPDPIENLSGGGARESDSFTEKCPGAVIK